MRVSTVLLAAVMVIALTAVTTVRSSALAAGPPELSIQSKLYVSGLDDLTGSGTVTLTFKGEAAIGFRHALVSVYDHDSDGMVSFEEFREFADGLGATLVGRPYWGLNIDSVTNFTEMTDANLGTSTYGLLYTDPDDEVDAEFGFRFDSSADGSSKLIQLSQGPVDTFLYAINATSSYKFSGAVSMHHRTFALGIGSFTTPDLSGGRISEVRTPLGNIVWYSFEGEVDANTLVEEETLTFERFSVFENQQMAFIVLLVGAALVLRQPGKRFEKYKLLHPRKYRKFAKPLDSVRFTAYALAVLMVILYALPYLFAVSSREAILYSSYLFFIIPAMVMTEWYVARVMYSKAALEIPEDTVIEVKQARIEEEAPDLLCEVCFKPIGSGIELKHCECGVAMHVTCAEKVQTCPSCEALLFPQRTRSIECRSCGDTFLYSGNEGPYSIQCTKCGAFQEEIKAGKNYLVIDSEPTNAYQMIRSMAMSERPALVLTSDFPGKIRGEHDLGDGVEVKRFSDSTTDIDNVNPKDLDGDAMEIASTFLMTTKSSGLLVDGVEFLVKENGFEAVLAFIRRLNDLAAIHNATVILWVDRASLPDEDFKKVADEFDEAHDYQ
jgi:hypothetical protein